MRLEGLVEILGSSFGQQQPEGGHGRGIVQQSSEERDGENLKIS